LESLKTKIKFFEEKDDVYFVLLGLIDYFLGLNYYETEEN